MLIVYTFFLLEVTRNTIKLHATFYKMLKIHFEIFA